MELSTLPRAADEKLNWVASIPYFLLHVAAVATVIVFPPTTELVLLAVGLFFLRMFGITAGYHRYFAHRGFKTGRVFQFVLAWLGTMSSQKGVLWWSGLHRHHHKYSDLEEDIHSPKRGFWWSHHGWILCPKYDETPASQLKEFADYPELVFINKYWVLGPVVLGLVLAAIGGMPYVAWGTFLSTVVLYHATFTINSLAHVWGSRRYETTDTSRNNFWLALLTMGEGWHNNHHHYQSTARNGFFWWEIDLSYYVLVVLSWVGVVWDLRQPPQWILEGKSRRHEKSAPTAHTLELPPRLEEAMSRLAARTAELEGAAAERIAELRLRIGEAAAHAAEVAAEAAQDAKGSAAAVRAAEIAAEAEAVASQMARALEAKLPPAWASAATAAKVRAEAALA